MLSKLKAFFEREIQGEAATNPEHQLQLAAAALLIETARADFSRDSAENVAITLALKKVFALSDAEVNSLVELAEAEADEATSLYQFTRLVNDHYSEEQKKQLIELLWQVAWADGDISKYEDHLIRRVAELTYVSHKDFIAAKLAEQEKNARC